jgi:hypothetical protein
MLKIFPAAASTLRDDATIATVCKVWHILPTFPASASATAKREPHLVFAFLFGRRLIQFLEISDQGRSIGPCCKLNFGGVPATAGSAVALVEFAAIVAKLGPACTSGNK